MIVGEESDRNSKGGGARAILIMVEEGGESNVDSSEGERATATLIMSAVIIRYHESWL